MSHTHPEPYYNNASQVQRQARELVKFILSNEGTLRTVSNGLKWMEIVTEFKERLDAGERLSPNQLAYLDGIYEKVVGALTGLPSVPVTHDPGARRPR